MKYLKPFNESKSLHYPEHGVYKQTLKDICLDLEDEGYIVKIFAFRAEIEVSLFKGGNPKYPSVVHTAYSWDPVVTKTFDRMIGYMEGEGFKSNINPMDSVLSFYK